MFGTTKTQLLFSAGIVVVILFVAVLSSTFVAALISSDPAANLLSLLETMMGWEELLAVLLAGVVTTFRDPFAEYLRAASIRLAAKPEKG